MLPGATTTLPLRLTRVVRTLWAGGEELTSLAGSLVAVLQTFVYFKRKRLAHAVSEEFNL
jgi:hypothetical protein